MEIKKTKKFRPQFRRGRSVNAGHPVYVYNKKNDTYHFVGLTHSAVTKGIRNIELDKNPNPKDTRKSYARPKTGSTKDKLQTTYKDWSFCNTDKSKINRIIRSNKKK